MRRSSSPTPPERQPIKLVQITTVPDALTFLRGPVALAKSRGFEVVAISSPGELLDAFGNEADIPVFPVEMPRRIAPLADLRALVQLTRLLRQLRPHIVHAQTPKGGLLGTTAAWLAGVPARLYHIRRLPMLTATGYKRTLLRYSEKVACTLAGQVLCVSHSIREEAIREHLGPADKIKVLFHGSGQGVDAAEKFNPERIPPTAGAETRNRLGIPEQATVIGFIGRIVRDKGVVELTQAWMTLRRQFPDLHLLMVGPLETQDPIPQDTVRSLQDDPRVHLVGVDKNTPPLYAATDIVALPTYREGFPNVALETAAMALPIVATRVPGCVDAVEDGVTGTLVPVQDAQALTEALQNYITHPDLRAQHGHAARARVLRDFRPESIWQATFDEYLALLQKSGIALPTA